MEIASYILEDAYKKLSEDVSLPCRLANTVFFLSDAYDTTILAFGAVSHNNIEYKIGILKQK
jgi:hypothetical protein